MKLKFNDFLKQHFKSEKPFHLVSAEDPIKKYCISKQQKEFVIKAIKSNDPKTYPKLYYWQKSYSVREIGDSIQLMCKDNKEVVALEDLFDVLWDIHVRVGYQGRASMKPEADNNYANISRDLIDQFLSYSEEYQLKRKKFKTNSIVTKVTIFLSILFIIIYYYLLIFTFIAY